MVQAADTLSISVRLAELAEVYAWIDEAADGLDLPRQARVALQIVAEEAVSNVIRHGYPAGQPEPADRILLLLEDTDDAVTLTIEDRARPFDPTTFALPAPAASLEETVPGGHGIRLIRRKAAAMGYERRNGINRLTLQIVHAAGR
jgi:serine/threonine-protein kinase RsbW